MDEEEYGGNSMADLRQFIPRASQISTPPPPYQPPLDHQFYLLNPVHHYHQQPQHLYGMVLMSDSHVTDHMINPPAPTPTSEQFHHSVTATATTDSVNTSATAATPMVVNGNSSDKFDGGSGLGFGEGKDGTVRWPRQETLTLLKIRSRLDYRFKEANQKGPLWDEVSRIMLEEHGYQRSGKKCREKFENLYKYYKKTREGNAGRQDGKHYRFFKQLEAIYGDRTNQNPIPDHYSHHRNNLHYNDTSLIIPNATTGGQFNSTTTHQKLGGGGGGYQSLSLSNSSSDQFDVSSSEDFNNGIENGGSSLDAMMTTPRIKRKRLRCPAEGKRNWEVKMKEFVDSHMRKVMEKQEACLDTIMRTIEQKEQERIFREEEWRKQESERLEREHKFWNDERAWIEARDKALMDALKPVALAKEADEEYNQQYYHHRHSNEELLLMNAHLKPLQPSNKENANGDDDDRKLGGGKDGGIINEEHKWDQQQIMMQVRSSMDRRM